MEARFYVHALFVPAGCSTTNDGSLLEHYYFQRGSFAKYLDGATQSRQPSSDYNNIDLGFFMDFSNLAKLVFNYS